MAAGVGAVVAAGALLGLVAGAFYLRARGKATGFGFSTFQVGPCCVGVGSWRCLGPSVLLEAPPHSPLFSGGR